MRKNLALHAALVTALGFHVCQASDKEDSGISAQAQAAAVKTYPQREAYYGDLHLHTGYSFDAYLGGARVGLDEAYRFAIGESVDIAGETVCRTTPPLDFLAVTDHAEWMGVPEERENANTPRGMTEYIEKLRRGWSIAALIESGFPTNPQYRNPQYIQGLHQSAWQRQIDAANRYYKPGTFTTLIGYEWTMDKWYAEEPGSLVGLTNIHRNVIFAGSSPPLPFTSIDSSRREDLWAYMNAVRRNGGKVLAIPHNSNRSRGWDFALVNSDGTPIDKNYATERSKNEPLVEIVQNKGQSEARRELFPPDEFADFEPGDGHLKAVNALHPDRPGSYARSALGQGLALMKRTQGVNPFKFGFTGSSDFHNGRSDSAESPSAIRSESSAGLTGVWAERNTREAIFAALERKETFATSGTRMKLRFFGGWGLKTSLPRHGDWTLQAYETGVPMGGDLPAKPAREKAPSFALWALKDPDGANLDRIQVIKLWVEGDGYKEKIFEAVLSDGREADPKTGKAPAVGSTVDLKTATYRNTIGATQLTGVWQDPSFDPATPAVYYIRVLEIPTPRWTTIQSVKTGEPLPDDVPATIQERGWSSPIWYTPSGIATPLESAKTD